MLPLNCTSDTSTPCPKTLNDIFLILNSFSTFLCHFSPSRYYTVNRGISADYCPYPGGPPYMDEYPLYAPGGRPESICTISAVGGYDQRWAMEEKRHSLRDGPPHLYGPPMPRDSWGPQYYGGMEASMRRLSIQPRSRSVPRSPSSSSGGPYSPVPPGFMSPARSLSARFDRYQGRMREDVIYADPSIYSMRRSLSSPKVRGRHFLMLIGHEC